MKEVPEEITILYHLQTLNLSDCSSLEKLPMAMKDMTGLRHLYTHGCPKLKSMPPDLGHLTSLQMLTCFVAGTDDLDCSNIRELEKLDLGGQLELCHLENVTRADAKAANLKDKRKLEELKLSWKWIRDDDKEAQAQHKEVLDGLKPHDGLKVLRMDYYGGRAFPAWMLELQGMVELKLQWCQNLEKLPALWKLPELKFLYLDSLDNLHCMFSGGPPSKFEKLESMVLDRMPEFVRWWDMNELQGEEPIFPKVEYLRIWDCERLTALPEASVVKQSSSRDGTNCCRSAFPALRKMKLRGLEKFQRWEAFEGEHVTFPSLEDLEIDDCPELIDFPEAPKLSKLSLTDCSQQAPLQAASKYISSLSSMQVFISSNGNNIKQNWKQVVVRGHESLMKVLDLRGCHVFFSHPNSLALWKCLEKLECLEICECNDLEFWPENLFRGLVSLRTLKIQWCPGFTGLMEQAPDEQSASERPLPCLKSLESLEIICCKSLVQVPNLRAPRLKRFYINKSEQLRSIIFSGEGAAQPADTSSSSLIEPVSVDTHAACFFECLESLEIYNCSGLSEIVNLPRSLKTLKILRSSLASLPGEVLSLEELSIESCERLQSLPDGPYTSLRVLEIKYCEGIRMLPGNLQECLDHPDKKKEIVELDPKPESMSGGASTSVVLLKQSSSTSSNHPVFPCLESLTIHKCDGFTKVAHLLPSITTLELSSCKGLVSLSAEVPLLEELNISGCENLESLSNGPAHQVYSSLRVLKITNCKIIKQLPSSLQQRQEKVELDSKPRSMSNGASTAEQASSTSSNRCFFPCLESLEINWCDALTEVANLPRSIKTLRIFNCRGIVSIAAEVPLLEELNISGCESLKSLPDGPAHQAYSSLRVLKIENCGGIKQLPPSLQQRLDNLEEKALDPHLLQGSITALMSKLACFRSRGVRRLDQDSSSDSSSDSS